MIIESYNYAYRRKMRLLKKAVAFFLFIFLFVGFMAVKDGKIFAAGNTYYVATTGNDTTGNGSISTPWKSVKFAVTQLAAGDKLYVRGGTYTDRVTISNSGTSLNRIQVVEYQGESAVLGDGIIIQGNYVDVVGFTVKVTNSTGLGLITNEVHAAVDFKGSSYSSAQSLTIDTMSGSISFSNGAHHNTASNNNSLQGAAPAMNSSTSYNTVTGGYYKVNMGGNNTTFWKGNYNTFDGGEVEVTNRTMSEERIWTLADSREEGSSTIGTTFKNCKIWGMAQDTKPAGVSAWPHPDYFQIAQTSDGRGGDVKDMVVENCQLGSRRTGTASYGDPRNSVLQIAGGRKISGPITFRNNIFLGGQFGVTTNTDWGARITPDNIRFYNNLFYNNSIAINLTSGQKPMPTVKGYGWESKNNIFFNGNPYAFNVDSIPDSVVGDWLPNFVSDYNLHRNRAFDRLPEYEGTHSFLTTQTDADFFVAPDLTATSNYGVNADWHLKATSSAINKGTTDSRIPINDKDGNLRVGATDIGPYEYGGTTDTVPPVVGLTSPADGSIIKGTTSIGASASDAGGSISKVEFYLDANKIGEATTSPFLINWDSTTVVNGVYTLVAKATDNSTNTANSTPRTITVSNDNPTDSTVPVVSLTTPTAGQTLSGNVTITANATDNVEVSKVEFFVEGIKVGEDFVDDGSGNYTIIWSSTGIEGGTKIFTAKAVDSSGNTTTSNGVSVTIENIDSVAPYVAWSTWQMSEGMTVVGSKTLNAAANDSNGELLDGTVTKVEFYIDGILLGEDTTSPYGYSLNSLLFDDGQHSITAKAYDSAGNTATSAAMTINIANNPPTPDVTPPTASITSPSAGSTLVGSITFSANASDNVGVTKVEFYLNGAKVGEDTTSPYNYVWSTTLSNNGSHSIMAKAFDALGNTGSSNEVQFYVNNPSDTTAPTVSLSGGLTNGMTITGTRTLNALASDNTAVAKVEFYVKLASANDYTLLGEDTSSPYGYSWNTTGGANGSYNIKAKAYDTAGNTKDSAVITVTVANIVADTTAPTATITNPKANADLSGIVSVVGTASDAVGVVKTQLFIDGVKVYETTNSGVSYSWDVRRIDIGAHTLQLKAYDAANNLGSSSIISVNVLRKANITKGNGGKVVSNKATVEVAPLTAVSDLEMAIVEKSTTTAAPSDKVLLSNVMDITAVDMNGSEVSSFVEEGTYADISLVLDDSYDQYNTLSLYYLEDGQWKNDGIKDVKYDKATNTLTAKINHLTEFAVMGDKVTTLPVTGINQVGLYLVFLLLIASYVLIDVRRSREVHYLVVRDFSKIATKTKITFDGIRK